MNLQPGQIIDAYRIVKALGSGASGEVYQVEHTITGRLEALKVLIENQPDFSEIANRFMREIRVQASLNHPNIVVVHNALWTGEHLLLVLELVNGESLEARLARGRLPLPQALDFAAQALAGLACAHTNGIIHCDISPANLLITNEGQLKIMDFGLAAQAFGERNSAAGGPVGSPYYMSPEHVRGAGQVNERSDIYSLGAVLYEMVTGRRVFEGTGFAVMRNHIEEEPKAPSSVDPSLPPSLDSLILKALAKHPGNRYSSAQGFLDALHRIGPSPSAQPVAGKVPLQSARWLQPAAFLSAFVALGIVLAAGVRLIIPADAGPEARTTLQQETNPPVPAEIPPPPPPVASLTPPATVLKRGPVKGKLRPARAAAAPLPKTFHTEAEPAPPPPPIAARAVEPTVPFTVPQLQLPLKPDSQAAIPSLPITTPELDVPPPRKPGWLSRTVGRIKRIRRRDAEAPNALQTESQESPRR
jgi:serine/threonine-protein kinase